MTWVIVGSVSSRLSRLSMPSKAVAHSSLASCALQTQMCAESSNSPHPGHLSVSHYFHLFINFPTPHMPATCLVTNTLPPLLTPRIECPIASQSTVVKLSGVTSDFVSQYWSPSFRWTNKYSCGVQLEISFLPPIHAPLKYTNLLTNPPKIDTLNS
jgi:hypothetical protein